MGVGVLIATNAVNIGANWWIWLLVALGIIAAAGGIIAAINYASKPGPRTRTVISRGETGGGGGGGGGGASWIWIVILLLGVGALAIWWMSRAGWFGNNANGGLLGNIGSALGIPSEGFVNSFLGNTADAGGHFAWGFDIRPSVAGALVGLGIGRFFGLGGMATGAAIGFAAPTVIQWLAPLWGG